MSQQVSQTIKPALVHCNVTDRRLALIRFWTFLSAATLIGATHLLWMPPNWSSFPQIPSLLLLVDAPAWFDYLALAGLIASLVLSMVTSLTQLSPTRCIEWSIRIYHGSVMAVLVFGVALVLLNQQRLQAWFYQLLVYCLVFLLGDRHQQLRWLRCIVLSIYVYSAIGKLDFEFAHTTGQELAAATFNTLGLDFTDWSEVDRLALALSLPLAELTLSVLLTWGLLRSRTPMRQASTRILLWGMLQWIPGVITCGFHLLLSGLLFWQLQHSLGVVLWNLQFAIQAILLFVLPARQASTGLDRLSVATPSLMSDLLRGAVKLLLMAVMFMPLAERLGYWDHWPSWALYAPHSSRVVVSIAPFAVKQLPEELQAILPDTPNDAAELSVPLSQWSLSALGVPVYPQARFQLGVARHLAELLQSRYSITAEILSPANRFTGERQTKLLRGLDSLRQSDRLFWLNTRPRNASRVALHQSQPKSLDLQ